jgi:hypothetical protein
LAFSGQKSLKKIWKQHISYQLNKGYRLVVESSFLVEKKMFVSAPYVGQIIHQSIALGDLIRNVLFPNFL